MPNHKTLNRLVRGSWAQDSGPGVGQTRQGAREYGLEELHKCFIPGPPRYVEHWPLKGVGWVYTIIGGRLGTDNGFVALSALNEL